MESTVRNTLREAHLAPASVCSHQAPGDGTNLSKPLTGTIALSPTPLGHPPTRARYPHPSSPSVETSFLLARGSLSPRM